MSKNNITMDDLAVMIKRGFDGVDKRFEQVDKRFEQVDKRFERLEKDVKIVKNSVLNLEYIATEMVRRDEFLELKKRLDLLEAKVR